MAVPRDFAGMHSQKKRGCADLRYPRPVVFPPRSLERAVRFFGQFVHKLLGGLPHSRLDQPRFIFSVPLYFRAFS
jgi:hypothetical protein